MMRGGMAAIKLLSILILILQTSSAHTVTPVPSQDVVAMTTPSLALVTSAFLDGRDRQAALEFLNGTSTLKIGYLPNISGVRNTKKQGIVVSGAITYAIDLINK